MKPKLKNYILIKIHNDLEFWNREAEKAKTVLQKFRYKEQIKQLKDFENETDKI